MPTFRPTPDLDMHYEVDDFTDPWGSPQTILMLHGNAESGAAWYGWVPTLARHYHVVRPDMRGFGASTPMPRDFPWTLDVIIDDYTRLMDHLDIDRFHLVGAKIGGTIARAFAARQPERVTTLTVVGTPPPLRRCGRARARVECRLRARRGRGLGAPDHGRPARQQLSGRRGRMVDPVHGPYRGLDPDRLYEDDRLR